MAYEFIIIDKKRKTVSATQKKRSKYGSEWLKWNFDGDNREVKETILEYDDDLENFANEIESLNNRAIKGRVEIEDGFGEVSSKLIAVYWRKATEEELRIRDEILAKDKEAKKLKKEQEKSENDRKVQEAIELLTKQGYSVS